MPETVIRYFPSNMKPRHFYRSHVALQFFPRKRIRDSKFQLVQYQSIKAFELFYFLEVASDQSHCVVICRDLIGMIFPSLDIYLSLVEEDPD